MKRLLVLAVFTLSACAAVPALAAECRVTDTITGPDGEPVKNLRVEFSALAPQTVNNTIISSKPVIALTDSAGQLRGPDGTVGVVFLQGAIVRVQAPDLGFRGQKILIPNTTTANLRTLVASYMTPGTAPAVDDATDLVMGDGDTGLVTYSSGDTIADTIQAINQAAGTGGGITDGDKGDIVVSSSGTVWSFDTGVVTTAGKALLDDADASAQRTTLGLGTAALSLTSDFEVPLTFSTGLTRSTNTITVNSTQLILKLSNLTTNGFVKTASGDGTLGVYTAAQATAALDAMVGDSGSGGTKGLVPAPASGDATKCLTGAGTWSTCGTGGSVDFSSVNAALATADADIAVNGQKITGLGSPSASTDAANAGYVDIGLNEVAWKYPARAATTANITLSGTQTIDGVSVIANDLVLVKNQSTASQNGVYEVKAGAWTRVTFMDDPTEVAGAVINVNEGSTNADTIWACTTNDAITVGSTSLTFARIDQGAITAGTGLTRSTNTLSISSGGVSSTEILDGTIALADMANLAQDQFIGRTTASTGVPQTATITAAARTVLDDTTTAAMITTLGAEKALTFSTGLTRSTDTITVANDGVSNTKLANMANATIKCRNTAGTGDPEDCTATQVTALLNAMVGDSGSGGTKGLAPAPSSGDAAAGKFLKADGTWAVPSGGSSALWTKDYMADQMLAVGTSWPTTAMADLETYNLVNVIAFDPSTSQGRGLEIVLPTGATTITLTIDAAAAASGFTTNNGVVMALDCRQQYSTGSFTQQVATGVTLTDNATIQRKTFSYTVSGIGATAGTVQLCEVERLTANASDTMTQDWRVAHIGVVVN